MGLGDKNLGAGFMNQGYGAASTMDEQEIIRMRAANGGRADIEDAYGRSGNMRVAKTLAYYGGGKRYQKGGKVVQGTGNDPYEYRQDGENYYTRKKGEGDWNQTDGGARDSIKKNYFANSVAESQAPSGTDQSLQSLLTDSASAEQYNRNTEAQRKTDQDAEIDRMKSELNQIYGVQDSSTTPGQSTSVARDPRVQKIEDRRAQSGVVTPDTPIAETKVTPTATAGGGGGGGGGYVDPRIESRRLENLGIDRVTGLPSIGLDAPDNALPYSLKSTEVQDAKGTPDPGPTWWDENQQQVLRGGNNIATGLLNIAPNIANINAYNNMEGVRAPNLARAVTTDAPSMEAGRQAIIAQGRNASNQANYSGTQSQAAGNAAAMAGTQSALSQYAGQEAQVEAQYDARNDQALNQVNQINTQTLNKNLAQQDARNMMQLRGVAQERAGIGSKTLGFLGGLDQQRLDRERMDLTRQRYNMYGQLDRAALKQFEDTGVLPSGYRSPQGG